MDTRIKDKYIRGVYLSLAASFLYSAFRAADRLWILLLLSGLLALSATVRHVALDAGGDREPIRAFLYLPDTVLTLLLGLWISPEGAALFGLTVLCDACLFASRAGGYGIAGLCFLAEAFGQVFHPGLSLAQRLSGAALAGCAYLAAAALISLARHEMETRQSRDDLLFTLKTQSKQLEDAYRRLKDAAAVREENAALRERARIARDMHDTVGHALTTGLISLEAGERLLMTGREDAAETISMAKSQIRRGLSDLRQAVHAMAAGETGFMESVRALIEDTRKQGVAIRADIGGLPELGREAETALLRALQEGLTNGLKHGGATAFVFRIAREGAMLVFLLEDNGRGCASAAPGFGLTAMRQRAEALGGTVAFASEPGEGFCITVTLPLEGTPWNPSIS